jgi:hypothetical protein
VAEASDRGELLTALTTEHFTLQGARSQTMNESSARAALYIGAVSSTLVALGFLGQLSPGGDTFNTFALTVLPTLYLLGVVTFVRMVECGAEDFRYGLAINRIRGYHKQLAGDQANLFLLSGPRRRARRVRQRGGAGRGAYPVLHLRERGGRDQQRGRWQRDTPRLVALTCRGSPPGCSLSPSIPPLEH